MVKEVQEVTLAIVAKPAAVCKMPIQMTSVSPVQCLLNGLNAMSDYDIVSALSQCVLDGDSVSKSTWEQLLKTVKLLGKTLNVGAASRGPVTLVLDRVKLLPCSLGSIFPIYFLVMIFCY